MKSSSQEGKVLEDNYISMTFGKYAKRSKFYVLGAPDPEMSAIDAILRRCCVPFAYATDGNGRRVHTGNAYSYDSTSRPVNPFENIVYVECAPADGRHKNSIVVDHHHPGDPGYGMYPKDFWIASSLGQVYDILLWDGLFRPRRHEIECTACRPGVFRVGSESAEYLAANNSGNSYRLTCHWIENDDLFIAAADHCLAAAYRGDCPGIDPHALMRWRTKMRASYLGRSISDIIRDIENARNALRDSRCIDICGFRVADMREMGYIPELPEAAARDNTPFIALVKEKGGRMKVVLQSACSELVEAFLGVWAHSEGLIDLYGDPARGYAGGYIHEEKYHENI